MNIFGSIKRMLKMGGSQIDLVTRDSKYYPSDLIRGELLITAPDYGQNIKSITIDLKEFWFEYLTRGGSRAGNRAERYRQHESVTIIRNYVFLPRMKYQYPFEVRLPINCRVSSEDSGWRLGVVISPSGSSVSRADFNIDVQLSKVLQTIVAAVEKDTKYIEVPRGRKYIPDSSATRFIFRPPEHLQSELQYLELDISLTEEGGIKGNMIFRMDGDEALNEFALNTVDTRPITSIISNEWIKTFGRKVTNRVKQ